VPPHPAGKLLKTSLSFSENFHATAKKKKKISHYTSNLTAFFGMKTIN